MGAIIGDVVGSKFEFNNHRNKVFNLFNESFFTDDTVLTIASIDWLLHYEHTSENATLCIKKWCKNYPHRGYGGRFRAWLRSESNEPYNSLGNGAAMRISPVGLYSKSKEECKLLSDLFIGVTHNHKEGMLGAYITSMCVYYAKLGKDKEFIKDYVIKNYDNLDFNYDELVSTYEFDVTSRGL